MPECYPQNFRKELLSDELLIIGENMDITTENIKTLAANILGVSRDLICLDKSQRGTVGKIGSPLGVQLMCYCLIKTNNYNMQEMLQAIQTSTGVAISTIKSDYIREACHTGVAYYYEAQDIQIKRES